MFKKRIGKENLNNVWRYQILFDTRSEVSCDEQVLCKDDLRDSGEQVFDEEC